MYELNWIPREKKDTKLEICTTYVCIYSYYLYRSNCNIWDFIAIFVPLAHFILTIMASLILYYELKMENSEARQFKVMITCYYCTI